MRIIILIFFFQDSKERIKADNCYRLKESEHEWSNFTSVFWLGGRLGDSLQEALDWIRASGREENYYLNYSEKPHSVYLVSGSEVEHEKEIYLEDNLLVMPDHRTKNRDGRGLGINETVDSEKYELQGAIIWDGSISGKSSGHYRYLEVSKVSKESDFFILIFPENKKMYFLVRFYNRKYILFDDDDVEEVEHSKCVQLLSGAKIAFYKKMYAF